MTNEMWIGAVVRALRGREMNRIFLVLGLSVDGMLLLSDGRYRKTERPKKKKIKHVQMIGRLIPENGSMPDVKITNRAVWKALEDYRNGEG
jgi:ribosomal protein L14E/L6E/L27E